jgi:serine/threonine-protein kinase ULK4
MHYYELNGCAVDRYVHSRGFLYCDLKPSNVLVNEYGILKLADFALSCAIPNDRPSSSSGQASLSNGNGGSGSDSDGVTARRGSPYYMAPELFRPDGIPSFASDIWSLGCLLFELATGQPPFFSRSMQELVQRIISASPSSLPNGGDIITIDGHTHNVEGFSSSFSSFIARCLDKDPFKRMTWNVCITRFTHCIGTIAIYHVSCLICCCGVLHRTL